MRFSKKVLIFVASIITPSMIVAESPVSAISYKIESPENNAMPSWIAFGEFGCTDDPKNQANKSPWYLNIEREEARIAEEKRVSAEKAKAKEREEAEKVAKTELEYKAIRDKMDCWMNEIIMSRGESVREYILPDKNYRKNTCD